MSVNYAITKSYLAAHPTGYTGRILRDKAVPFEEVVDRVARSNTTPGSWMRY